jgi:hypothetical protein
LQPPPPHSEAGFSKGGSDAQQFINGVLTRWTLVGLRYTVFITCPSMLLLMRLQCVCTLSLGMFPSNLAEEAAVSERLASEHLHPPLNPS